ncbi:hypothetical protein COOONC_18031 [Cooperia oncophora]
MARITRRKANTPDVGESIPLPTRHGVSQECTMVNEDFDKLSVSELLSSIIETNKDPIIGKMLMALSDKISNSFSDYFEREKRSRSIVIAGAGFRQIVSEPTHSGNILDVIFISRPIVDGVRVLPPLATSDHSMLSFSVDASLPPSQVPLPKPDFLRTDYTALGRSLSEVELGTGSAPLFTGVYLQLFLFVIHDHPGSRSPLTLRI